MAAQQQQQVQTTLPTGYGYSLLDSVLHSRVVQGRVRSTATRVMYCGRLAAAAGGPAAAAGGGGRAGGGGSAAAGAQAAAAAAALSELTELHSAALRPTVSGCLFALPQSFWAVAEGPPEDVAALLAAVAEGAARAGSRVAGGVVRVVAHVEDVPEQAFQGFFFRRHSPSADALGAAALAAEMEEAHPVASAVPTFRAIVEMGHALHQKSAEGDSRALLTAVVEEQYAASLPSDERVQALTGASKVRLPAAGPRPVSPRARARARPPLPTLTPPPPIPTTRARARPCSSPSCRTGWPCTQCPMSTRPWWHFSSVCRSARLKSIYEKGGKKMKRGSLSLSAARARARPASRARCPSGARGTWQRSQARWGGG